jgi:hypothetical protein
LIFCISAAGNAYCPLFVSSDPAARQVFDQGAREAIDLRIEFAPSPDAHAEIFGRYCGMMLILAGISSHEIEGRQNKHAILFCSNYADHFSEDVSRKHARHGILVLSCPPHISQMFQALGVPLLAELKRTKSTNDEMMRGQWWITFCDCFGHMRKQHRAQQSGRFGTRQVLITKDETVRLISR